MGWLARGAVFVAGILLGAVLLAAVRAPERPRALHEMPGYAECASVNELAAMLLDGQPDTVRVALQADVEEMRDAAATRRFRTCRTTGERVLGFLRQFETASAPLYMSFPCAEEAALLDRYADPGEVDWAEAAPWLSALGLIRAMRRAEEDGFRRACARLMFRARTSLDLPAADSRLPTDGLACRQELDVAVRYTDFNATEMNRTLAAAQRRLAAGAAADMAVARRALTEGRFPVCAETARRVNARFRQLYATAER